MIQSECLVGGVCCNAIISWNWDCRIAYEIYSEPWVINILCVESFHQGCAGGGGVRLIPKNGNQPKEIARLDNVTVKVIYSWWCPIGKDPRGCNFQYDNMDNLISGYWQLLKKAFVRETHFEKNFPLRIAQLCWIFQVSSQAGCPLDCRFCDSGKAGLIEQVRAV